MVRTGRTETTYKGHRIIRCNWEEGRHRGKWYVQAYHSPTGMPWSDEECPHYDTIAGARDYIRERAIIIAEQGRYGDDNEDN